MKTKTWILVLIVFLVCVTAAIAQQTKETFDKRNLQKKSFISRFFSAEKKGSRQSVEAVATRKLPVTAQRPSRKYEPAQWNNDQRLQAEKIWKQQRDFRAAQRQKQLNREPTAWEIAYSKEEKLRQKALKKLLKERDKRVVARLKSRQKAMAVAAKYKRKKLKNMPERNHSGGTVFTSAAPSAGNGSRIKP